jgi:hypothetical protein
MSELCVELLWNGEQPMPLPGSWISATYLFQNKFKDLNKLLKSAAYTITRESVFLFPYLKI